MFSLCVVQSSTESTLLSYWSGADVQMAMATSQTVLKDFYCFDKIFVRISNVEPFPKHFHWICFWSILSRSFQDDSLTSTNWQVRVWWENQFWYFTKPNKIWGSGAIMDFVNTIVSTLLEQSGLTVTALLNHVACRSMWPLSLLTENSPALDSALYQATVNLFWKPKDGNLNRVIVLIWISWYIRICIDFRGDKFGSLSYL